MEMSNFLTNVLNNFRLKGEKEDAKTVIESVERGIVFTGTNLWILVFAIFIASLGLNVNSTAVIIGAMLVSPLMGPIIGIGMGMAVNDLSLLKRAFYNYMFAAVVGLVTSTVFFLISPLNEAHSEILARTAPNVYDVLIAFFGGLAGVLATSSRQKGNVIPGVAIATALMPPLCTAGFGLATLQFTFFFGAFYLFIINTVFIALAAFLIARFLKFPFKDLPDANEQVRAKRIVWVVVIITLAPSIYFAYDIVQKNKFEKNVERFIENEAVFPNDYLLKKTVDAKTKTITLVYGGEYIEENSIAQLQAKLKRYNLQEAKLEVKQGFSYLNDEKGLEPANDLSIALEAKQTQLLALQSKLDSINKIQSLGRDVHKELKVNYPALQTTIIEPAIIIGDSIPVNKSTMLVALTFAKPLNNAERAKIKQWMAVRLKTDAIKVVIE